MASSSKAEQSYIRTSLLASTPLRSDGRSLEDFRPIALETSVVDLANGSARVCIGGQALHGVGGDLPSTEVLAAVKLEVETGEDAGKISCNVSCTPSAYPQLSGNAIDDLQYDLTSILQETLSHPTLQPSNLIILPKKKGWLLHLDLLVLSDSGNILDALFLASAAALQNTRVPRTRSIEYKAIRKAEGDRLLGEDVKTESGLDTRTPKAPVDFELVDYWDEGEPLKCAAPWPICITLNLLPPIHYLDATTMEEDATNNRLMLLYSCSGGTEGLQGMRLLGSGEVESGMLKPLLRIGATYASKLCKALDARLHNEKAS